MKIFDTQSIVLGESLEFQTVEFHVRSNIKVITHKYVYTNYSFDSFYSIVVVVIVKGNWNGATAHTHIGYKQWAFIYKFVNGENHTICTQNVKAIN